MISSQCCVCLSNVLIIIIHVSSIEKQNVRKSENKINPKIESRFVYNFSVCNWRSNKLRQLWKWSAHHRIGARMKLLISDQLSINIDLIELVSSIYRPINVQRVTVACGCQAVHVFIRRVCTDILLSWVWFCFFFSGFYLINDWYGY